jgi:hypothetical protein
LFTHFFNPYIISLNLKDFNVIFDVFYNDFFRDPNFEAFVYDVNPNIETTTFDVVYPHSKVIASNVVDETIYKFFLLMNHL